MGLRGCKPRPREERFWKYVQKSDGCWEWTGFRGPKGYGVFTYTSNQPRRAHRVSYEMAYGAIPDGMLVCHHCDNPACVRPEHLFLGTNTDNVRDMIAKGRNSPPPRFSSDTTRCKRGHEYTPENTYTRPKGTRACRICSRRHTNEMRARRRAKA